MYCICCQSRVIVPSPSFSKRFHLCKNCGLIFKSEVIISALADNIVAHYHDIDPHEAVGFSKKFFFEYVLNYLGSKIRIEARKILDVGCGYGYFLKMAVKRGWEPTGVELVEDAVKSLQKEIGCNNIFQGKLKTACLSENSFDAITLWDVIAIVDNPYDELQECYRLLKKGGIIGIRTRNVLFQISVFRLFRYIRKIALRFGLKKPYVFNKYCFSSRSLYALLYRLGFINIKITNSPLTSGDPYNQMSLSYHVKLLKTCINILSEIVFWMTRGRWLIGPSLLVWAEKP